MSFDWSGYLECAESLARSPDEASKRSAVSRAYYAAFNVVRVYLRLIPPKTGDAHRYVWEEAAKDRRREIQQIAKKGDRLKQRRRNADYDGHTTDNEWLLKDTLDQARKILETISRLRDSGRT